MIFTAPKVGSDSNHRLARLLALSVAERCIHPPAGQAVASRIRNSPTWSGSHSTTLRLWVLSRQMTSMPGLSSNSLAAAGVTFAQMICPMSIATKTA